MQKISLIAAISKNRGLGNNDQLLFRIPEDLKRFKDLTAGHAVIMGRKTFESIGNPLPNRTNIFITRHVKYDAPDCKIAHSLLEAIGKATKREPNSPEIFVIGGGQIYSEAIKIANKLYLTLVDAEPEADAFFPPYDNFKKVVFTQPGEYNGLKYTFLDLEK